MKRVIKIIFLSVLIQSIYSQRKCLIQENHCAAANDENYICEGDVGDGCVAIPRCENAGKGETDCQNYPVSKDKSGNCILSNGSCKQRLFCEYNNEARSDSTCRDYQISPPNDGKVCVLKSQGYGCEAKFKCESVPNSESESCSSFPVEDKNYVNAKTCINDSSGTKKCKEEYYCGKESPSQSNDEGCKNYVTSDSNKICVFEGSGCTEKLLCTQAQGAQVSDSNCPLYTPSFDKRATYSCVKNPDKNECVEQTSCPFVSGNNINCENYPVTNANKNTHACVSNPEGPSACKEELLCSQTNTENLTADQCRLHPISNRENKENYLCVPKSDNTGCEEKLKCEAVTDLGNNDCSDFPTTDQINKGCTDNTGGNTACKEQIFCTKATQGNTNEECMDYPVTDNTKYICLKNDEENSPCKEVELCDTIIGETLTDSDCLKYPVSKDHQSTHTCIKDPYKNKCMEQFFCNSVPKYICSNYPVTIGNEITHYCSENPNGDTPCQEIEIPTSSELSNESDELNTNTNTSLIEKFQSTILDLGENTTNSTIETTNTTLTTLIVLLGFSNFVMAKKSFTFNTHFIPLTGSLYSKKLIFSGRIIYNNNYFRQLEDSNFECTLSKNNAQSSTNYLCEVQIQNKDIKQIKLLTNFMFTSQDKVLLTGITPIAKMSLNNINKIDTKFNNLLLSNPPIFILDNCTISNNYEDRKLNISGTIKGNKPKSVIVNNSLALMINIEDDANELSREIKCIVISMKNYNYTLDCELYSKGIYNFQSALSIINDGILVINFDNIINENEKALVNYDPEDVKPNIKKSKRISAGAIVGIILGSLALLAGIIIAIIFIRKKNKKEIKNENPSIQQLKILRVD